MKTKDEIKEEIQLAELGRDTFRAIRCAREPDNLRMSQIAADWESVFTRRLNQLTTALAKVQKRNAA